MEQYIKVEVSDITYQSELTLDTNTMGTQTESYVSRVNSSFALLRTRWTILNKVKNLARTTYVISIP